MRIKKLSWAYIISIFFAIAVATCGTPTEAAQAAVVANYWQVDRDGRYVMRYETAAGVVHFETGYLRRTPTGHPYQVKEGYYLYPTADGRRVRLAYFADHEGYRVTAYEIRES